MKMLIRLAALALFALPLAACGDGAVDADTASAPPTESSEMPMDEDAMPMDMGGEAMPMNPDEMPMTDGAAEAATVEGGVQVAEIEAGRMGYEPRQVTLQAGVPARLVFTRTVDDECSSQVTVPAYDVPVTDLPLNEPVAIEFTPTEAGTVEFVCGMDMQRGTIAVVSS